MIDIIHWHWQMFINQGTRHLHEAWTMTAFCNFLLFDPSELSALDFSAPSCPSSSRLHVLAVTVSHEARPFLSSLKLLLEAVIRTPLAVLSVPTRWLMECVQNTTPSINNHILFRQQTNLNGNSTIR